MAERPGDAEGTDAPTYDLQARDGVDLVHAGRLAVELEDEEHVRRLSRRTPNRPVSRRRCG